MIASGDTQALPRIPAPAPVVGASLPTVALTLGPLTLVAPAAQPEAHPETPAEPDTSADARPEPVAEDRPAAAGAPAEAESHERIYAEAMASLEALASNWSSAVQRATGRHHAAA